MYDYIALAALLFSPGTTRDRIGEPYPFRSGKRREITTEWVVGPGNTDPDHPTRGEDGEIVLTMTSYHYGDRKQFATTLRVEIVCKGMRQTTLAFGAKGESYDVLRTPVARFSAKAMREHHARCQELIRHSARHAAMSIEAGVGQYLPANLPA